MHPKALKYCNEHHSWDTREPRPQTLISSRHWTPKNPMPQHPSFTEVESLTSFFLSPMANSGTNAAWSPSESQDVICSYQRAAGQNIQTYHPAFYFRTCDACNSHIWQLLVSLDWLCQWTINCGALCNSLLLLSTEFWIEPTKAGKYQIVYYEGLHSKLSSDIGLQLHPWSLRTVTTVVGGTCCLMPGDPNEGE